ncbi:MAG: substrate-binding domain-containing protein, partial [Verrucomicrobiota bacterium]
MMKIRRIAILADPHHVFGRNAIRGAIQCLDEAQTSIQTSIITRDLSLTPKFLEPYHGFLTAFPSSDLYAISNGRPVVSLDREQASDDIISLPLNNYEIGSTAARTLFHNGSISFGYFDGKRIDNTITRPRSDSRLTGFCEELIALGVKGINPTDIRHPYTSVESLRKWISTLPKPTGVFAFNDLGALEVNYVCHQLNMLVPHEVKIIGVDNDPLLCSLAKPPLSSVEPGSQQLAYQAMQILIDKLTAPMPYVPKMTVPAPVTVGRESTGACSIDDEIIKKAMSEISQLDRHSRLTCTQVAKQSGASLRSLELLFKKKLGRTVQQEISRHQIEQTKLLLRTTQLTIEQISEQLHEQLPTLRRSFQRIEGMTPGNYRRQSRASVSLPSQASAIRHPDSIRICLMSPFDGSSAFDYLRGAQYYARQNPEVYLTVLTLPTDHSQFEYNPAQIETRQHDGFILPPPLDPPSDIAGHKPIVYLEHQRNHGLAWSIGADNIAVGTLVAQHFLFKGHRHFAYFSHPRLPEHLDRIDRRNQNRYRGFHEKLQLAGIRQGAEYWNQGAEEKKTIQWLQELPRPTAIFAFNDIFALQLIHLCQLAGLRVPEDIALIGVDDDPLRCRLSHPTLSSIHLNLQYAGFEAMRIAAEAVRSKNPSPVTPHTYLPAYVAERASSAGLASDDPALNRAARYI